MPDIPPRTPPAPARWRDAFAALPLETPPAGGWHAVIARRDTQWRPRAPLWLAMAATVLLAIALPWRSMLVPDDGRQGGADASPVAVNEPAANDPMEALYAESARLESLLAIARDDSVSSGTAMALSSEFESQLATIDAALMQPGLTPLERRALWQQRVDSLRAFAGFEGNRRWLASQGTLYDAALVLVD